MLRRLRVLVAPLFLLIASACAHHQAGEVQPAESPPVRVEVTNHNALPAEIYAIGAGITYRLGTVHPGMVSQFVIPQNIVGGGSIVLQAQPSATGPQYRSGELLLAPGAVVDLVIRAQLFSSTATVRP